MAMKLEMMSLPNADVDIDGKPGKEDIVDDRTGYKDESDDDEEGEKLKKKKNGRRGKVIDTTQ